jgi:hypothetical protein
MGHRQHTSWPLPWSLTAPGMKAGYTRVGLLGGVRAFRVIRPGRFYSRRMRDAIGETLTTSSRGGEAEHGQVRSQTSGRAGRPCAEMAQTGSARRHARVADGQG